MYRVDNQKGDDQRMVAKKKGKPGLNPIREFPYFKIQYWDQHIAAWVDIQKSFRSIRELIQSARLHVNPDNRTRIMEVQTYRRRRIVQGIDAFGIEGGNLDHEK